MGQTKVADEIADHISALEAENERLRAAGRDVVDMLPYHGLLDLPELRAALDEEVGDRNDIDQICRDNSAAVEEMMAANRGGGGVSDHPRDCPHGRQWGKCDTCDLIGANAHIAALEAENDYAALEYKREHALRLEIEADNERLRSTLAAKRIKEATGV